MLVLNPVQTNLRIKPLETWSAIIGGLVLGFACALMIINPGGSHYNLVWWPIGGLCLFGIVSSLLLYTAFQPAQTYEPRLSFKGSRASKKLILKRYRFVIASGLAFIFMPGLWWVIYSPPPVYLLLNSVGGGLGMISFGYYGLISSRVHDDIDTVAVELARELGSSRRNRIFLGYANFLATDLQAKLGNSILLVGADRLIICQYVNDIWQSIERPFQTIRAIGLTQNRAVSTIYFEFNDGNNFRVGLDPTHITTTEPSQFLTSLLTIIDDWCENPRGVSSPVASRRRIVADSSAHTEPNELVELVGQANELQFAAEAIGTALAATALPTRRLEI